MMSLTEIIVLVAEAAITGMLVSTHNYGCATMTGLLTLVSGMITASRN